MKIDAKGLMCPEPIMMLHKAIREISKGEKVELYATDPSTQSDIDRICEFLGHNLLKKKTNEEPFYFLIEKKGNNKED